MRLELGAPAVPEHPVSRTGDLWLLGRHRLLCGDSTVATDVERVLGGVTPHLMVTDPPPNTSPVNVRAHAREGPPEIKDRGRPTRSNAPTRSSAGGSSG